MSGKSTSLYSGFISISISIYVGDIFDICYSMFLCGQISMRGLIYRWMVDFGWDLHVDYFLGSLETSGDGAEVFMGMKSAGHVIRQHWSGELTELLTVSHTDVYSLYMFIHVYTCLYMFIHVYTCLYMFIHVYTCLYMFTNSNCDLAANYQIGIWQHNRDAASAAEHYIHESTWMELPAPRMRFKDRTQPTYQECGGEI